MESDPFSQVNAIVNISFYNLSLESISGIVFLIVLLSISALISGSEVAFFSFSPDMVRELKEEKTKKNIRVSKLLSQPEKLLATILITNNFVNIGIVILTSLFIVLDKNQEVNNMAFINFSNAPGFGVFFQVVIVTFLLLLFGEIIPKVYANHFNKKFAFFMVHPLFFLQRFFSPLSFLLINVTSFVNRIFQPKKKISKEDLSQALDIAGNDIIEEKEILHGILSFGDKEVKEIMTPRMDVVGIDFSSSYNEVVNIIITNGYSRLPVYEDDLDNIKGILFVKDLIKFIGNENHPEWKKLIRDEYYVPENKKINDLLEEFQAKKIHLACVSDEYGGIKGLITMEDILEEIVGEINDEFDSDEIIYKKIDDKNYIFEGKTLINDFCKIVDLDDIELDKVKGESETLAGLILELRGEFPQKEETIIYKNLKFKIEAFEKRRIQKIKVTIIE